jgi:hypothetical protein
LRTHVTLPEGTDRFATEPYQGPFPQYSADAVIPGSDVIMVTTPSTEIVPNYGMGLSAKLLGRPKKLAATVT